MPVHYHLSQLTGKLEGTLQQSLTLELSGRPCLFLSKGQHPHVMSSLEGQCTHLSGDSHVTINHRPNSSLLLASQAIMTA